MDFQGPNPELQFIWAALHVDGERVFDSPEHVGSVLDEGEAKDLGRKVLTELVTICPMYGYSDSDAWNRALVKGAADNVVICMSLDSCVEYATTMEWVRMLERPQMYWGKPLCELLDGHWMVFRAAREVMDRERKKVSPSPKARSPRASVSRR